MNKGHKPDYLLGVLDHTINWLNGYRAAKSGSALLIDAMPSEYGLARVREHIAQEDYKEEAGIDELAQMGGDADGVRLRLRDAVDLHSEIEQNLRRRRKPAKPARKPFSAETRAKYSAAAKARWAKKKRAAKAK